MTLSVVTTPGAVDANAYCSLAEAEAYVATMTASPAWTGKTDEQKKAAIIQAARWIDTLQWRGVRSNESQAMAWPRCEASYSMCAYASYLLLDQDGFAVASDAIPTCIKNANAEMAVRQLGADWTQGLGPITKESQKVGPIEFGRKSYRPMPSSVLAFVKHFLLVSPNTGGRLVRG